MSAAAVPTSGPDRATRGHEFALLCILASVTMLFAAFTAAYLIRRTGTDWAPMKLPGILLASTAILLISSATMEAARRSGSRPWLWTTVVLGLVFFCVQFAAWRSLVAEGVYLPSNAHSAFFYMLTGAHAVHLVGGIIALLVVATRGRGTGLAAVYWHFLGLLWVYLYLMLSFF